MTWFSLVGGIVAGLDVWAILLTIQKEDFSLDTAGKYDVTSIKAINKYFQLNESWEVCFELTLLQTQTKHQLLDAVVSVFEGRGGFGQENEEICNGWGDAQKADTYL